MVHAVICFKTLDEKKGEAELEKWAGYIDMSRKIRLEHFNPIEIAYGSYSTIYRGGSEGHYFAIKVVEKQTILKDARCRKQMRAERFVLTRLKHRNVVNLHYAFQDKKRLCLVMPFVNGGTLEQLANRKRHPIPDLWNDRSVQYYVTQIYFALLHLHHKDIVHGDISARNVMIDGSGCVKLVDFGSVTKHEEDCDGIFDFKGTVQFSSPEAIRTIDHKGCDGYGKATDMWSLGVLAFLMSTGELPFDGKTEEHIKANILRGEYKFPEVMSKELKSFITLLLADNPKQRLGVGDMGHLRFIQHGFMNGADLYADPPYAPNVAEDSVEVFEREGTVSHKSISGSGPLEQHIVGGYEYDKPVSEEDGFREADSLKSSSIEDEGGRSSSEDYGCAGC